MKRLQFIVLYKTVIVIKIFKILLQVIESHHLKIFGWYFYMIIRWTIVLKRIKYLKVSICFTPNLGHADVVALLIENGSEINAGGYKKRTPLHMAAFTGFLVFSFYTVSCKSLGTIEKTTFFYKNVFFWIKNQYFMYISIWIHES